MITWINVVSAILWCLCGVLTYGLVLAHYQRKYHRIAYQYVADDVRYALMMGVMGPFGLATYLISTIGEPFRGFMWRVSHGRAGTQRR